MAEWNARQDLEYTITEAIDGPLVPQDRPMTVAQLAGAAAVDALVGWLRKNEDRINEGTPSLMDGLADLLEGE